MKLTRVWMTVITSLTQLWLKFTRDHEGTLFSLMNRSHFNTSYLLHIKEGRTRSMWKSNNSNTHVMHASCQGLNYTPWVLESSSYLQEVALSLSLLHRRVAAHVWLSLASRDNARILTQGVWLQRLVVSHHIVPFSASMDLWSWQSRN